ncbi:hypothetical protein NUW58_g4465 [Xylaria curta]|uniref:Uncharacterized protein n=1 Tax=Xylaria curta TaxID=42375 RepID=A0ACC1P996_9PEZI|nr:hypothetical protein NUW58_g4465 [Xylaria curta]
MVNDMFADQSSATASMRGEGGGLGGSSGSLSEAEKRASISPAVAASTPTSPAAPTKLRSCVVCRSRKVRCNKESPCSNCRRAGIPCVVPSADRPPRWARRLERVAQNAAAEERAARAADSPASQVMERLRNLESLVKDLSSQLEQAHAAGNSTTGNSPASSTQERDGDPQRVTPPSTGPDNLQSQFGRLVVSDAGRGRYVSTGFWSRVNDELAEIKMGTQHLAEAELNSSEDEDEELSGALPSTHELERTASERHGFLFRHHLSSPGLDLREFHPLPSQVPFLIDVFSENINGCIQIVHMPTIRKIARRSRGIDITELTPANEALMFSIYYAAITSMEEDDVLNNFGSTKTDLNLKYRLGIEYALAKADFLNVPDVVLVQAFAIFLLLVRRHDSPRFVWMMAGLLIRMAQALGLQRDGTHFKHLTPFEIDMRRRVWFSVCVIDVRASEDQGTDFSIPYGSFDTKLPWNINEDDIDVDTKETPMERQGITDMTLPIVSMEISNLTRQMMLPGVSLDEQNRLLDTIFTTLEERYLRFSTEPGDLARWVMLVIAHLVRGKLTLLTHLPVLFSSPSQDFSDEVRNKLLVAAIEVAEFNHALNAEKACRQWRWVYQTYTHWHAVVYLLIDICRRPWSPFVDRAWAALQSPWLIPARSKLDKGQGLRTWVPLRKLMLKARKHREAELERLRGDISAACQLEVEDRKLPVPSIVGSVSATAVADAFREKWRTLVGVSEIAAEHGRIERQASPMSFDMSNSARTFPIPAGPNDASRASLGSPSINPPANPVTTNESLHETFAPSTAYNAMPLSQPYGNMQFDSIFSTPPTNSSDGYTENGGLLGWFWADADPSVDIFADMGMGAGGFNADIDEMDWHNWVKSAKGMEMDSQASNGNPNG